MKNFNKIIQFISKLFNRNTKINNKLLISPKDKIVRISSLKQYSIPFDYLHMDDKSNEKSSNRINSDGISKYYISVYEKSDVNYECHYLICKLDVDDFGRKKYIFVLSSNIKDATLFDNFEECHTILYIYLNQKNNI